MLHGVRALLINHITFRHIYLLVLFRSLFLSICAVDIIYLLWAWLLVHSDAQWSRYGRKKVYGQTMTVANSTFFSLLIHPLDVLLIRLLFPSSSSSSTTTTTMAATNQSVASTTTRRSEWIKHTHTRQPIVLMSVTTMTVVLAAQRQRAEYMRN